MEHPKISGLYRCFSFSEGVCSGFMLVFWLCMLLYAGVSLHIRETVFIHLTSRKFDATPTQTESTFNHVFLFTSKYYTRIIEFHYFTSSMFSDVLLKFPFSK